MVARGGAQRNPWKRTAHLTVRSPGGATDAEASPLRGSKTREMGGRVQGFRFVSTPGYDRSPLRGCIVRRSASNASIAAQRRCEKPKGLLIERTATMDDNSSHEPQNHHHPAPPRRRGGVLVAFGPDLAPRVGLAPEPVPEAKGKSADALTAINPGDITSISVVNPGQSPLFFGAAEPGKPLELPGNWPVRRNEVEELVAHPRRAASRGSSRCRSMTRRATSSRIGLAPSQDPVVVEVVSQERHAHADVRRGPGHGGREPVHPAGVRPRRRRAGGAAARAGRAAGPAPAGRVLSQAATVPGRRPASRSRTRRSIRGRGHRRSFSSRDAVTEHPRRWAARQIRPQAHRRRARSRSRRRTSPRGTRSSSRPGSRTCGRSLSRSATGPTRSSSRTSSPPSPTCGSSSSSSTRTQARRRSAASRRRQSPVRHRPGRAGRSSSRAGSRPRRSKITLTLKDGSTRTLLDRQDDAVERADRRRRRRRCSPGPRRSRPRSSRKSSTTPSSKTTRSSSRSRATSSGRVPRSEAPTRSRQDRPARSPAIEQLRDPNPARFETDQVVSVTIQKPGQTLELQEDQGRPEGRVGSGPQGPLGPRASRSPASPSRDR